MREPRHRYVAVRDEPLNAILDRIGLGAAHVEAGVVFVDGRRATHPDEVTTTGQCVEIFDEREPSFAAGVRIIDTRQELVAAYKPAGLPTEPDRAGGTSLRRAVADLLRVPEAAVHAASRLDAPVSGVVVLALHGAGRRYLTELQRGAGLQRRYVAIAMAVPSPRSGVWDHPVPGRRGGHREPRLAVTRYAVVREAGGRALLALEPVTGRTHQLRVHAALAGVPLMGDRARGGAARWVTGDGTVRSLGRVALHAAWVRLSDRRGNDWHVQAPFPEELSELWSACGGGSADYEAASAPWALR